MKDIEARLDNIEHYSKVPLMKPFIGKNYFTSPKRILIICESHYFDHYPKNENPKCNPSASVWYSYKVPIPQEKLDSINTREIVKKSSHRIYANLKSILSEVLQIDRSEVLESIAYMNAFQRPANHAGVSMKNLWQERDSEVAVETISKVIDILKPKKVIFASKFSWEKVGKRLKENKNYDIQYTSHPNSVEWNNTKSPDNKKKFFEILM